jgi:hypothetical protein
MLRARLFARQSFHAVDDPDTGSPAVLNTDAHLWPSAEDRTRRAAGELMAEAMGVLASCGPYAHRRPCAAR